MNDRLLDCMLLFGEKVPFQIFLFPINHLFIIILIIAAHFRLSADTDANVFKYGAAIYSFKSILLSHSNGALCVIYIVSSLEIIFNELDTKRLPKVFLRLNQWVLQTVPSDNKYSGFSDFTECLLQDRGSDINASHFNHKRKISVIMRHGFNSLESF